MLHLDYALNGDNLTIMWEAPFSLDIPQIDPDVKYCVTIKSSGEILHSECEIRDTEFYFRFDGSFPYCEENSAIVTPYNDVVGNGSSNLVYLESEEGKYSQFIDNTDKYHLIIFTLHKDFHIKFTKY